jgi:hypothetical protein
MRTGQSESLAASSPSVGLSAESHSDTIDGTDMLAEDSMGTGGSSPLAAVDCSRDGKDVLLAAVINGLTTQPPTLA